MYQFQRWSEGFFGVSASGCVEAYPSRDREQAIILPSLISDLADSGIRMPSLIRFPQIAQQRVVDLDRAFQKCIQEYGYKGSYRCIYPVKVSPHFDVVQSLLSAPSREPIGLEAGSKAELLAVIASANNSTPILCNGFKDHQYIEMALRAVELGRQVTIVVEKPIEFAMIHQAVKRIGVKPSLGVRMKLNAKGVGHWESTGGSKSKFGLTVSELLDGINQIQSWSLADKLEIVHFHLGSQITEIRYLKNAVIEATRIYTDLVLRGLPVSVIDVGGGLGIDYCGKRMAGTSSINYSWQEYANDVVHHIQTACDQAQVAHPQIFSESGRATVAHQSVLVVPIIGQSTTDDELTQNDELDGYQQASPPVCDLRDTILELSDRNLLESYHDAEQAMDMAGHLFRHGHLSLQERADAEVLFRRLCHKICEKLSALPFVPEELKALDELLADNNFANFSVFQSLPDHWAINQLFPIAPLHRLLERPTHPGVLSDITCDSDGRLKNFVSGDGEAPYLLLHRRNDQPYFLGVFLAGAYQEILGDKHNLLGQVNVVDVSMVNEALEVNVCRGDAMKDVLLDVGYTVDWICDSIQVAAGEALDLGRVTKEKADALVEFYRSAADGYTYLEPNQKGNLVNGPHFRMAHQKADVQQTPDR